MLIISLVPLLFSSFLHFSNASAIVEVGVSENLGLTAYSAHKNILEFLQDRRVRAIETASDRFLALEAKRLNSAEGDLNESAAALNFYLAERKTVDPSILKMHVLDLSGRIVSSTDAGEIGSFKHKNAPHFVHGLEKAYVENVYGEGVEEYAEISIGSPIKSAEGAVVGVLEYDYDLNALKRFVLSDLNRLHGNLSKEGMDFFIANEAGQVLSCSKETHPTGKDSVSFAAELCNGGQTEWSGKYDDSNGTSIYLAVECIRIESDWLWAFSVEQETESALAPVQNLANTGLIIALVTACAAGILAFASIQRFTNSIEKITKTVDSVSKGDFEAEIPEEIKTSEDELGDLARAFDRTFVSLKLALRQTAPALKKRMADAERELEMKAKMLEFAQDAIFIIDKNGIIEYANKRAQDFCGCAPTGPESGSCKLYNFIAPEHLPIAKPKLNEALKTGSTKMTIDLNARGKRVPIEATLSAVDFGGKQVLLFVARDLSERVEAEAEKREEYSKFKTIFDFSPEAIILIGKDRKIAEVNPRVLDWVGYKQSEVVGKSFMELPFISLSTKAMIAAKFVQRMAGVKLAPYEMDFIARKGGKVRVRLTGTTIVGKDGKPAFDLVMMSKVEN